MDHRGVHVAVVGNDTVNGTRHRRLFSTTVRNPFNKGMHKLHFIHHSTSEVVYQAPSLKLLRMAPPMSRMRL